jgi:hypothetical protein
LGGDPGDRGGDCGRRGRVPGLIDRFEAFGVTDSDNPELDGKIARL